MKNIVYFIVKKELLFKLLSFGFLIFFDARNSLILSDEMYN